MWNVITHPCPNFNDGLTKPPLKLGHIDEYPDSKVHGANMGPTWVLSAPDGPHVGPMNLAIRVITSHHFCIFISNIYRRCTNTLRPGQNGRNFADDILKYIFSDENCCILIEISLKFDPNGAIDY